MSTPSPERLDRARALAVLLDDSIPIPGTGRRIGLDPLLGLIPGVGDVVGAALGGYLVWEAARLGAPRAVLLRMLGHLLIETVVGGVPLLGDLFDAGYKANRRNLRLLEEHVLQPGRAARASRGWLLAVAAGIFLLMVAAGALAVAAVGALLRLFGG